MLVKMGGLPSVYQWEYINYYSHFGGLFFTGKLIKYWNQPI